MVKKITALLLVMVMCISMVACGGNGNTDNKDNTTNTGNTGSTNNIDNSDKSGEDVKTEIVPGSYEPTYGDVEIEFWYSQGEESTMALVEKYMDEHPNVKIKTLQLSFFDYSTKLIPALAGGTAPDVYQCFIGDAATYARSEQAVNINDAMIARGFDESQYIDRAIEISKYEGDLYSLPWMTDVRILYYNKDHFAEVGLDPEQPPTTWAEVKEYAEKISKFDQEGNIERLGFHASTGNLGTAALIWTHGGKMIDGETAFFTSDEVKASFQTALDIQESVGGYDAYLTFSEGASGSPVDAFCMGDLSMVVNVDNYVDTILEGAPDMNWGAAVLPTNDGVNNHYTWSAGFALSFYDRKDADRLNAAIDFGYWLCQQEQQEYMATETANLVCHKEAFLAGLDSKKDTLPEEYMAAIKESLNYVRYNEVCLEYPDYYSTVGAALKYVHAGMKTIDEALEDAQMIFEQEVQNYHLMYDK